jgi:hypothetical protein
LLAIAIATALVGFAVGGTLAAFAALVVWQVALRKKSAGQ